MEPHQNTLLYFDNISYRSGRARVLSDLSLALLHGEVHTLLYSSPEAVRVILSILTARTHPRDYFGTVYWEGIPSLLDNPQVPLKMGIAVPRTNPLLIRDISLQENLFLTLEDRNEDAFIDYNHEESLTWDWIHLFKLPFKPQTLIRDIEDTFYPLLEVIRALNLRKKLLTLHQDLIDVLPSSVQEILRNQLIRDVRQGLCVLYLCTNPTFLWQQTHRASQLRRGRIEKTWVLSPSRDHGGLEDSLIYTNLVLPYFRPSIEGSDALLSLHNWEGVNLGQTNAQRVDIHCYEGTLTGLGGLYLHNQRGIMEILGGIRKPEKPYSFLWFGEPVSFDSPIEAMENRIGVINHRTRLIKQFSLLDNLLLKLQNSQMALLQDDEVYLARVQALCKRYAIVLPEENRPVNSLNSLEIQLVILVQALLISPIFLLLENSTIYLNQRDKLVYFDLIERIVSSGITVLILLSSTWDFSLLPARKVWISERISADGFDFTSFEPKHSPY